MHTKRYYPKLTPHGSVTRPIPEPVRQWALYDHIGRFLWSFSATTAQADRLREHHYDCTIEPINPTTPHER